MRLLICLGTLVLLWSATASAHDIWITVLPGSDGPMQTVINYGHPGDRRPPDPDKLFEFRAISPNGQERRVAILGVAKMVDGIPVLLVSVPTGEQSGGWLIAAQYDNGYWVKTDKGHRNTSKLQFPNADESLHSMKFAKALQPHGKDLPSVATRVLGHRLELVPLADPSSLSDGTLRVRVLFEGKPLPQASVEIGDGVTPVKEELIPRYTTNQEGIAEIPIKTSGLHVLSVDHRTASRRRDLADHELLVATLTLVVGAQQSQ